MHFGHFFEFSSIGLGAGPNRPRSNVLRHISSDLKESFDTTPMRPSAPDSMSRPSASCLVQPNDHHDVYVFLAILIAPLARRPQPRHNPNPPAHLDPTVTFTHTPTHAVRPTLSSTYPIYIHAPGLPTDLRFARPPASSAPTIRRASLHASPSHSGSAGAPTSTTRSRSKIPLRRSVDIASLNFSSRHTTPIVTRALTKPSRHLPSAPSPPALTSDIHRRLHAQYRRGALPAEARPDIRWYSGPGVSAHLSRPHLDATAAAVDAPRCETCAQWVEAPRMSGGRKSDERVQPEYWRPHPAYSPQYPSTDEVLRRLFLSWREEGGQRHAGDSFPREP
ncbi:hypothetical protein DFH09DRAFT_1353214 [Mycena vulgaris]|nr:hypothetical protein DFH09DRAFT_1353214 [Mycena vulgaris]